MAAKSDLPGRVWAAAVAADDTPGRAYLVRVRRAWPDGERLPAAVRWLPAAKAARVGLRLPRGAAGALCYLFATAGEAAAAAVQVEAVGPDSKRLVFGGSGKRPSVAGSDFGSGRRVFVARPGAPNRAGVQLAEGPLDALALVHLERLGAVDLAGAAVIAAAGVPMFKPAAVRGWPEPVTLWPDSDQAGRRVGVRVRLVLEAIGCAVRVRAAGGGDVTDWAAEAVAEREAMRDT